MKVIRPRSTRGFSGSSDPVLPMDLIDLEVRARRALAFLLKCCARGWNRRDHEQPLSLNSGFGETHARDLKLMSGEAGRRHSVPMMPGRSDGKHFCSDKEARKGLARFTMMAMGLSPSPGIRRHWLSACLAMSGTVSAPGQMAGG